MYIDIELKDNCVKLQFNLRVSLKATENIDSNPWLIKPNPILFYYLRKGGVFFVYLSVSRIMQTYQALNVWADQKEGADPGTIFHFR